MTRSTPFLAALALAAAALPAAAQEAPKGPEGETPVGPAPVEEAPLFDVVFVIDTTGSMSGLIEGAKRKVWSIANDILAGEPHPRLRVGLVAYRDHGDAYVTRVFQPSEDLDRVYQDLMEFGADGGGDGPEHVNRALADAFQAVEWSAAADLKLVYLVGDAPAHRDYEQEQDIDFARTVPAAREAGLVVNAVLCGGHGVARTQFQEVARLGGGDFFQIAQSGGMTAVETPFDEELRRAQREIDGTRVYFGSAGERAEAEATAGGAMDMDDEAAAHRASALARMRERGDAAPAPGLAGRDLVEAYRRDELDGLEAEELPEEWRELSAEERAERLQALADEREAAEARIAQLVAERQAWLRDNAPRDGFDARVLESLRARAAEAGVDYAE